MGKLCLCMIVKNESKIIKECLNSIVDYIDYWVICDTGSTDCTQDIIKTFFEERGISGELHEDKWVDFAHNRTLAFNKARNKADYCFVIDADDRLIGNLILPEGDYSDYRMKITLGNLDYYRSQIFKNDLNWKYVGVVHEYPCLVDLTIPKKTGIIQNCTIKAGTFGDRSRGECKFKRDIKLLLKGLETEPNNARYYFYLAQSYKDMGDNKNAIKYYKKRVEMGEWYEEVYHSLYSIGICKQRDGVDFENEILYDYLKAYNYKKNRLEALYEIVKYYRINNKFREGYSYGQLGVINKYPEDILFINKDIHTWKFFDEVAICAYYVDDHKMAIELNTQILNTDHLNAIERKRVQQNINFSINKKKSMKECLLNIKKILEENHDLL